MADYIYGSKDKLNNVQSYLNDVDIVLSDKTIDASKGNGIVWSSNAMKKTVVGLSVGVGAGAVAVAGTGAAIGAGTAAALAGTGVHAVSMGTASLLAGTGATAGAAATTAGTAVAGSLLVPVLIAALPVAAVAGGIVGGLIMFFRGKEEKERLQNELKLYQEAVKKQNDIAREMASIKARMEKMNSGYEDLYKRYVYLKEINKQLMEYIRNLESDLKKAKVV